MANQQRFESQRPTPSEEAHNLTLEAWCLSTVEPKEESERRRRVLEELNDMCKSWIRWTMITEFKMPPNEADVGGRIFTTGSYRHNVHFSGSDIDCVLVAPEKITRHHFFSTFLERLRQRKDVSEIVAKEDAIVPIITMIWDGIDLDLGICTIKRSVVPDDIPILDNRVLADIDDPVSLRSVNGVRVAQLLIDLVPDKAVFRQALRFVKVWAKKRGIYSAKLGFPSGIGWAILVARVCQAYPNLNGAGVITRFFRFYSGWFQPGRVNAAIFLTESLTPKNPVGGHKCWPYTGAKDANALFPVITPAFPYQNATYNVTATTLGTLCEEFTRGHEICTANLQPLAAAAMIRAPSATALSPLPISPMEIGTSNSHYEQRKTLWDLLMEPYPMWTASSHYLHTCFASTNWKDYDAWVDFCEAKMRWLWTEGPLNTGAALECFPQLKIRVFSSRFEDPKQIVELQRLREAEKMRMKRNPSGSPEQGRLVGSTVSQSPESAPRNTPSKDALANHVQEFSCHFFFPLFSGNVLPNQPKADVPNVIRCFQKICQDKMTVWTKLPQVRIIKQSDLPPWLPGLRPSDESEDTATLPNTTQKKRAREVEPHSDGTPGGPIAFVATPKRESDQRDRTNVALDFTVPTPRAAETKTRIETPEGADELLGLDF